MICIIYLANNTEKIKNILGIEIQKEETLPLLSYVIYNNENSDSLKVLATINSESGIEYVEKSDGTKINGNGKNKIGLDYVCTLGEEEKIKIKEIGKEVAEDKILITEAGNVDAPIIIMNSEQLLNLQERESKIFLNIPSNKIYYKLGTDIDLADVEWTPIGTGLKPFAGTLDGDGHTISNLSYSGSVTTNVGLFGYTTGTLNNIKLDNVNITGTTNTGALAGCNTGTIKDVTITNGEVNGTTTSGVLVGYNFGGIVSNNIVEGNVTNTGDNAGCLIGASSGTVNNNTVSGTVTSNRNNAGGLIGYSSGVVNNNTVSGTVTSTGNYVGGLIGYMVSNASGNISNVDVSGNSQVGGLIGHTYQNSSNMTINLCKATGNVSGINDVGGMIGLMNKVNGGNEGNVAIMTLQNSIALGNVTATGNNAGGLVGRQYCYNVANKYGYKENYILNCYSTGSVYSEGYYIGGLVGMMECSGGDDNWGGEAYVHVYDSFSTSNVKGNSRSWWLSRMYIFTST